MSEGSAKAPEKGTEKPRKVSIVEGVRDILPPEAGLWKRVEQTAREVFATYGYSEIRPPVFEQAELFARSIGSETDVVSKEMYTFHDRERFEMPDLTALRGFPALISLLADSSTEFRQRIADEDFREILKVLLASQEKTLKETQSFLLRLREALVTELLPQTERNKALLAQLTKRFQEIVREADEKSSLRSSEIMARNFIELLTGLEQLDLGIPLALRPEATASVCRAYIEHGMHTLPQPVKLYYMGPMFRRERPQKGRYRQFYQIGAEVLGGPDAPAIDAEVIEMVMTYFAKLGLEGAALYINSIGCKECRPKYVALLKKELEKVREKLGEDSQRRIETNPLRVLDSKLEDEQKVIERLPRISEHLCEDCRKNYADVKRELDLRSIKYRENWRLVRGLDYYVRTTFEITAAGLGSQNAVCGGGRYDGLVELLGGPPTKGTGFAIGEDRVVLSLQESGKAQAESRLDVYVAWLGEKAYAVAVRATQRLRDAGFSVELPATEQKFGKALGQADKLGARFALILGDEEVGSHQWTVKRLSDGTQKKISESEALAFLKEG